MEFRMSCISFQTDTEKRTGDEIEDADLLLSREFISESPYYRCSNELAELACIIINELQIDMPKDKESAEQLYF